MVGECGLSMHEVQSPATRKYTAIYNLCGSDVVETFGDRDPIKANSSWRGSRSQGGSNVLVKDTQHSLDADSKAYPKLNPSHSCVRSIKERLSLPLEEC